MDSVKRRHNWLPVMAVFAAALTLRLLHLWQLQQSPYAVHLLGDALRYDIWAMEIAAGDWIGSQAFYQAPLYPYLLGGLYSLAGHDILLARLAQALLGSVSCVLIALAGERLFGRRAGIAAGLIVALYGPAIFFDSLLQKSVLDVFLISLLLLLLVRPSDGSRGFKWFVAGLTLGALALTRENALVLVPIAIVWLYLQSNKRAAPTLLMLLGLIAILGPFAIRNRVVGGSWRLTTFQSGANLFIGNNEHATGTYVPLRSGHGSAVYEEADARELAEAAAGRPLSPSETSAYWRSRALHWIGGHPWDWARLTFRKAALLLNRTEAADTEDVATYAALSWPLRIANVVSNFGTLAPLAVFGAWLTRRRWREVWVLYAMPLAYAGSVLLFFVLARYRYPLVPFLALFAGVGIASAREWWASGRTRGETSVAVILVGTGLLVCHWPMALLDIDRMRAVTRYNIASALQAAGLADEALAQYREAATLAPTSAVTHVNLGVLLAGQGQRQAAVAEYLEALRLDPTLAYAHNNLASELTILGRYPEAIDHFRRSLALEPRNAKTHYNLATTLVAAGQFDVARGAFEESLRLAPDNADAHNNLGALLASQGHLEEALGHFRAAVRLRPDMEGARNNLERAERALRPR